MSRTLWMWSQAWAFLSPSKWTILCSQILWPLIRYSLKQWPEVVKPLIIYSSLLRWKPVYHNECHGPSAQMRDHSLFGETMGNRASPRFQTSFLILFLPSGLALSNVSIVLRIWVLKPTKLQIFWLFNHLGCTSQEKKKASINKTLFPCLWASNQFHPMFISFLWLSLKAASSRHTPTF